MTDVREEVSRILLHGGTDTEVALAKYARLLEGAITEKPLPQRLIGNIPGSGRKTTRRIEGAMMAIFFSIALDVTSHLGRWDDDFNVEDLLTDVAGLHQFLELAGVILIDKEEVK